MKKFISVFLIGSFIAFAGCQKDQTHTNEVEGEEVVVTACIKGAEETRTVLTPATNTSNKPYIKVNWKESGESFTVYGDNGTGSTFSQVSGNQFQGTLPSSSAGYMAYYKSTFDNEIIYDISEQDGTLNEDYAVMMAYSEADPVFFEFHHQTIILHLIFDIDGNVVDNTQISKIVMGGVTCPDTKDKSKTSITVTPVDPENGIYIFVPDDSVNPFYKKGHEFTFEVTLNGKVYNTSLTLQMDLAAGKYYTTTIRLAEPSCFLPDGQTFRAAIVDAMTKYSQQTVNKIKFEVGCPTPGVADVMIPGTTGAPAYLTQEGSILIIHTSASENFVFNADCSSMFEYHETTAPQMNNITSIDFANCETSQVTNMKDMFYFCRSLMLLENMNFNTENVTNMSGMFSHCGRNVYNGGDTNILHPLDLSGFNTSKVTDMSYMFNNCAVPSINISSFNTSNVTNMAFMFNGMSGLTSLDLSNFNTGKVTDMKSMFSGCTGLTSLTFPESFTTANVTNMKSMFASCEKLTVLSLLHFNTENVTDMSYMFQYCRRMTEAKVGSFKTPKLTNMDGMFYGCANMTDIYMPNFVNTCNPSVKDTLEGLGAQLTGGAKTEISIRDEELISKLKNSEVSGYNDTYVKIQQIYN